MANPDQAFQLTDLITERGLPDRRLIFAAKSKELFVLHYEKGGRGHSYHILFFESSGPSAKLAWRAVSDKKLNSIEDLKLAIAQDKLADNPAFFW